MFALRGRQPRRNTEGCKGLRNQFCDTSKGHGNETGSTQGRVVRHRAGIVKRVAACVSSGPPQLIPASHGGTMWRTARAANQLLLGCRCLRLAKLPIIIGDLPVR